MILAWLCRSKIPKIPSWMWIQFLIHGKVRMIQLLGIISDFLCCFIKWFSDII